MWYVLWDRDNYKIELKTYTRVRLYMKLLFCQIVEK